MISIVVGFVYWKQSNKTPVLTTNSSNKTAADDMTVIRTFMANLGLELSYLRTDLPMPYFRVGKVTKVGSGENMEAVDGWVHQVNVYHQKELLNGQCVVYEYHTDTRNHILTAVVITGLKPNEVNTLKEEGTTCVSNPGSMPKITKAEAETIALDYLRRTVPNLDQIWGQFACPLQSNGESHQWLWEDKGYKLPEGLEGRPWSYPTIRISVGGDREIQYWNTVSLFQN